LDSDDTPAPRIGPAHVGVSDKSVFFFPPLGAVPSSLSRPECFALDHTFFFIFRTRRDFSTSRCFFPLFLLILPFLDNAPPVFGLFSQRSPESANTDPSLFFLTPQFWKTSFSFQSPPPLPSGVHASAFRPKYDQSPFALIKKFPSSISPHSLCSSPLQILLLSVANRRGRRGG